MTFFSINIDFFEIGVSQIKLNKMVHIGIRVLKIFKKAKGRSIATPFFEV